MVRVRHIFTKPFQDETLRGFCISGDLGQNRMERPVLAKEVVRDQVDDVFFDVT